MAERYGPARLHSCGRSTHLLSALQHIRGLQEVHLGWDTDLAAARACLGPRPIAYLLPPAFLAQRPSDIDRQMRAALDANGDAPLVWWLTVDHTTPEAHLELAHTIWLEHSTAG